MTSTVRLWSVACLVMLTSGELLQNGGFESLDHWICWGAGMQCEVTTYKHGGSHAFKASGRTASWMGPSQNIQFVPGHSYRVSAWMKVFADHPDQSVDIMVDITFTDGSHQYEALVTHYNVKASDGYVHLFGVYTAPTKPIQNTRLYFQSAPVPIDFLVDDASVTEETGGHVTIADLNHVIDQQRKSDIHVHVSTASVITKGDVKIRVLQKKKSFPFGTAVNAGRYNANLAGGKYRDFIHKHYNWAVPEGSLKWPFVEPQRGQQNYQPALDMIHRLRSHGIKVRGHNLVWSLPHFVQNWVKALSGNELRTVVKQHIQQTMSKTHGLLEHWDVNNENLHGTWFQDRLHDPDYDLELFRIAHQADPNVKLFLNDFNVVASGASTNDYLEQAQQVKKAGVGLSAIGVQCHFGDEVEPDISAIKRRLDTLAGAGLPIWVTELDVMSADENRRADFYEHALRALYGHPAVEGILMWGFWDQSHWRGEKAALVKGDNLQMTAAGHRVLDLYENQWMTDETHTLPHSGNQVSVRGFHGDYEVHVIYQGTELSSLRQTFTLGKGPHSVSVHVQK
ncbi:uncharacterized protein [Littorina saxatilis]|uniref:GH10 domain-containing protein n=1 Tax=Littorina saxatilis TaxID=31220 RepID=A0AAN9GE54_9CAEN